MNLYKLHSKPKELKHFTVAHNHVPWLKWEHLVGPITGDQVEDLDDVDIDEVKKYEHLWAQDATLAFLYAQDIIEKPFPAGEKAIATNAYLSFYYTKNILGRKPFPAGEKTIATDAYYAYRYARYVLKKRFPAGEKAIATDAQYREKYEKEFNVKL